jgi:hypothetical protein
VQEVFKQDGAGDGIVEGIVSGPAGTKRFHFFEEVQLFANVAKRMGLELGIGAFAENQGVYPRTKGLEGSNAFKQVFFGGDVMGRQGRSRPPGFEFWPPFTELLGSGGKRRGDFSRDPASFFWQGGKRQQGFVLGFGYWMSVLELDHAQLPGLGIFAPDETGRFKIEDNAMDGFFSHGSPSRIPFFLRQPNHKPNKSLTLKVRIVILINQKQWLE